jgi:hypothetical protein
VAPVVEHLPQAQSLEFKPQGHQESKQTNNKKILALLS